jgi:hypothetical protein
MRGSPARPLTHFAAAAQEPDVVRPRLVRGRAAGSRRAAVAQLFRLNALNNRKTT